MAGKIYHIVGAPTLLNVKMMIRHNIIHNFPVTVEDIKIADKIFVFGVSTLKVITTRQSPKVVVASFIEITRELIENNQDLILCMGIIFINQQAFFTKNYKGICFCGLVLLSNITKEECYRALDAVMKYDKNQDLPLHALKVISRLHQLWLE